MSSAEQEGWGGLVMFRVYKRLSVVEGLAALEANGRKLWEESGSVGEVREGLPCEGPGMISLHCI